MTAIAPARWVPWGALGLLPSLVEPAERLRARQPTGSDGPSSPLPLDPDAEVKKCPRKRDDARLTFVGQDLNMRPLGHEPGPAHW